MKATEKDLVAYSFVGVIFIKRLLKVVLTSGRQPP